VKGLLLFVLVAAIAVWAGALLDVRPHAVEHAVASAVPERAQDLESPSPTHEISAPAPKRAPNAPAPAVATPMGPPLPDAHPVAPTDAPGPPRRSAVQTFGRVARALLASSRAGLSEQGAAEHPTRELGQRLSSPEYVDMQQNYLDEPRNAVWAAAEEQRVRTLVHGQAVDSKVALVHCQESVCRLVMDTDSSDSFTQLVQTPGIAQATGLSAQSPYSLREGQLSVLFRPRQ
jgi:hypothetical protein